MDLVPYPPVIGLADLEAEEAKLFPLFHKLPNGPEREAIYRKWKAVYEKLTLIYTGSGNETPQRRKQTRGQRG